MKVIAKGCFKVEEKKIFYPKLDKKESILGPFVEKFLEAPFLLREFVIDLPDVHRLQIGVAVGRVGLADVHK